MDYITCNYKKNRPRVGVAVCMKCRQRGNCPDYIGYFQLPLFPQLFEAKRAAKEGYHRDTRAKRMRSVSREIADRQKQLAFIP